MKDPNQTSGRPSLREELKQAVRDSYKQNRNQKQDQEPYQANPNLSPYAKTGMYLIGTFVLIWASQYALAALAGAIREYKNLKKAIKQ